MAYIFTDNEFHKNNRPLKQNVASVTFTAHNISDRITEIDVSNTQQLVDNSIFEMLVNTANVSDWDIELIGDVRDAVAEVLERKGVMFADEFYPALIDISDEHFDRSQIATTLGFAKAVKRSIIELPSEDKIGIIVILFTIIYILPFLIG